MSKEEALNKKNKYQTLSNAFHNNIPPKPINTSNSIKPKQTSLRNYSNGSSKVKGSKSAAYRRNTSNQTEIKSKLSLINDKT